MKNKKVIGKMKVEAAGMVIKEFIGLRSKMYSYEINNKTTKNAREYLNTNDYCDALFSSTEKKLYEIN